MPCYADLADAQKSASTSNGIPVVLEASNNEITSVYAKDGEEWIVLDVGELKSIASQVNETGTYRIVVANRNRDAIDSWVWKCSSDDLDDLTLAISAAMSPENMEYASLPYALKLHFALAEIRPDLRVDMESTETTARNTITAHGDWKWTKTAAVTVNVHSLGKDGLDVHFGIQDFDRAATDRFDCYVSLAKTGSGYDIGFQINASQLGIASNVHYWHYKADEYKIAKKTFHEIKNAVYDYVRNYEAHKTPFAMLGPQLKSILHYIDLPHRENTGVFLIQESFRLSNESDWRETLYGNRYPEYGVGNLSEGDFAEKITYRQEDQKSQTIEVDGRDSRSTQYKTKYAWQSDPFVHPVIKRAAIRNFQEYIQDLVSVPHIPVDIVSKVLSCLNEDFIHRLQANPTDTILASLRQ